ncbi:hypothetical protein [Martelella alba]|uniref:Uncharacterized protein n=1 Tax=Martelella alba TaxID=2590451 RepID=A0ABY2SIQ1_9HYPH|nr:hypothetical protein [Martelella alba]TKI05009.1 hypothetical protein FCN80_15895 [Martelella alba]
MMRRAEQWVWRLTTRPMATLAAGTMMVLSSAALIFGPPLNAGWQERAGLRDQQKRLTDSLTRLRKDVNELPPAAELERGIGRLRRDLAACAAQRGDFVALFPRLDPGRDGKLTWQASAAAPAGEMGPRHWTAEITTDYAGLRSILQNLAGFPGAPPVSAFEATARDGELDVRFELAETELTDGN